MAGVIQPYSEYEVRVVIHFLQAEGVTQSVIHRRLVNVYGQNVLNRKEVVRVWSNKFKDGRTTLADVPEEHRGRSRALHTEKVCHCGRFDTGRSQSYVTVLQYFTTLGREHYQKHE